MASAVAILGRARIQPRARKRPDMRLRPTEPVQERALYEARVTAFWDAWEDKVFQSLGLRQDASDFLSVSFERLLDGSGLRGFFRRVADSLANKNARYAGRVLKFKGVPAGRDQLLANFRDRNISLIKGLGDEQATQLRDLFQRLTASGKRAEEIAPEVQKILDVGKSRARLIARDQTLKMNSQLQQLNQKAAGVTQYRWWTVRDDSVRPRHADLHNTIQSWDDPPDTGNGNNHPGEDIQCRCQAIPEIALFEGI